MNSEILVLTNIVPLFGLIYLAVVILDRQALNRKERALFQILWTMEMLDLLADNTQTVMAALPYPTAVRIAAAAVSYSMRPAMILILIALVYHPKNTLKNRLFLLVPEMIAVAASFSALFSDLCFSYDQNNVLTPGPAFFIPYAVTVLYLAVLIFILLWKKVLDREIEKKVIAVTLGFIIMAMICESFMGIDGISRTAIVICTIFFASALQTTKLHQTIYALQENRELKNALTMLQESKQQLEKNRSVMQMLGEDYTTVIYAPLQGGIIEVIKADESHVIVPNEVSLDIHTATQKYAQAYIIAEERQSFMEQFSLESIEQAVLTGKGITARFDAISHNGKTECMEYHLMPALTNEGAPAAVIGLRNVDEQVQKERLQMNMLREALEQAKAANSVKEQFLSRMSHDIRTPLNGIIGLLKIDELHQDDLQLINSNRRKIQVCADHLLSLVNDVLDMSKIEDNKVSLASTTVYLPDMSDDIETIVRIQGEEKGITMVYDNTGVMTLQHPYICCSPVHVRQILLNLYSNSIKYTDAGGTITTEFREIGVKDDKVILQMIISDTGIGISSEFLPHIFEPFTQDSADARSVYQGTGLGMAIVKGLVDRMDGTIEVESEPGKGTVFTLTIPFVISSADALPSAQQEKQYSLKGMKILLAEDNMLNNEIAVTLLEEAGASITSVYDGQEACDTLLASPDGYYDVIMLDIMMPRMDGLQTAKAIRESGRKESRDIPIIAMSANAFEEDIRKSLDAGMNRHLVKPLDMKIVLSAIVHEYHRYRH